MRWTGAAVLSVVVLSVTVFVPTSAQADLLTFPNNVCSGNSSGTGPFTACVDSGYINQTYGDTANVDVIYKNLTSGNPSDSLRWWSADYNDLVGILWADGGDCCSKGRIELAPLEGQAVTLNGLDLGAWPHAVRPTSLRVFDRVTNAVLFSADPTIGTGDVSNHFAPGVTSSNGLAIEWFNSAFNVGIDNVDFTATSVSEPGTLFLLGVGLAALVGARRRSR